MNETKKIIETYDIISNLKKDFKKNFVSEAIFSNPVPIPAGFKGNFGQKRSYEIHPGTDIPVPSGTEIKAPADGVVVAAIANQYPCGGTLDIDYGNGFWSRFCHVKRIDVKNGDKISQGQVIGLTGGGANDFGRGNSQGAHLHFTLKKDGQKVDPMDYMGKFDMGTQNLSPTNSVDSKSKDGSSPESVIGDLYTKKIINSILSSMGISEEKKLKENISKIKKLIK